MNLWKNTIRQDKKGRENRKNDVKKDLSATTMGKMEYICSMKHYKKHTLIVSLLFVYMTGMFFYFFPRNTEMSETEKWLVVAVSYVLLIILWFTLRQKYRLRKKNEDELNNPK